MSQLKIIFKLVPVSTTVQCSALSYNPTRNSQSQTYIITVIEYMSTGITWDRRRGHDTCQTCAMFVPRTCCDLYTDVKIRYTGNHTNQCKGDLMLT